MKTVLFYRDFKTYRGGHQKVADYYFHLQHSNNYQPSIVFSTETLWDKTNPWFPEQQYQRLNFEPNKFDYLFLAGMDWEMYLQYGIEQKLPVINLIQGVRHGQSDQNVYPFLSQKAIRICVSQEVANAIKATGKVNGPIITIPGGHSIPDLAPVEKNHGIIILGNKQPKLAREINSILINRGIQTLLIDHYIDRDMLYDAMNQSQIAVLLPQEKEGLYLPALEAMKYCNVTIVPDCVGNRSFCFENKNCLMPDYTIDDINLACEKALDLLNDKTALEIIRQESIKTLNYHTLERERHDFLNVMLQIDQLWSLNHPVL